MIPQFPEFKPLELSDRKDIEAITRQFPSYSDFNFTSMYSWDDGNIRISFCEGNLVIILPDYLDSTKRHIGFLGLNRVVHTAHLLLQYAESHLDSQELSFIPEEAVSRMEEEGSDLVATEDEDHHDYVISVEDLATMKTSEYRNRRNLLKKCLKQANLHTVEFFLEDVLDAQTQKEIVGVFDTWGNDKDETFIQRESVALQRFLNAEPLENAFLFVLLRINGQLSGFSIVEKIDEEHCVIHFEKVHRIFPNMSVYYDHMVASHLFDRGCKWLNIEQDLGIPGLRVYKRLLRPVRMLRKYRVRIGQN